MKYINEKIDSNYYKYIIILFFIGFLYYFNKKSKKNIYNNYDKIYFINLEKRKDRYKRFNVKFKNSDFNMNYELFKAIDGKQVDLGKYVTQNTLNEILQTERNGKRKYHYQLTRGAIGCYLSHMNIWKDILDNNINQALILEDDANLPKNLNEILEDKIKYIPKDYDIILLGCKCLKCKKMERYKKVKRFWLTHSYIITNNCIKKIYDKMFPIKQQIDSEISDLSDLINIYALDINVVNQYNSKSDIQIPINNNSIESFKNYHD